MSAAKQTERVRRAPPRWLQAVNLLVFLAALLTVAVVVNFFAQRPAYRAQIDATKTRAYSLSDQTRHLLSQLQGVQGAGGAWTIAVIVSDTDVTRSMRKQIDEVLRRYTDASPSIRVLRIDPDNPRTIAQYEQLLTDLQAIYKDQITAYDKAIDEGVASFKDLQIFAQQQAPALATLAQQLPKDDPSQQDFKRAANDFNRFAELGGQVLEMVNGHRQVNETQPIPDYEGAQSILAKTLRDYASAASTVAEMFRTFLKRGNLDAPVRTFASNAAQQFDEMSRRLALAADPLLQLPPMELGDIGRELKQHEAAVILGPKRAAVIPSNQLFPKSNLRSTREGGIAFDQRFRGEQLISAAIRSLTIEHMPLVVFVHAEADSLLQVHENKADVSGAASMLKASRYEVKEWNVSKGAARPQPQRGQKVVWVVVPPAPKSTVEANPATRALVTAVESLIADGENVLLSVYPSLLAKYGQPDPFVPLAAPFGLKPDTAALVVEQNAVAQGESQINLVQFVENYSDETAIGRAVDGQRTCFGSPVPLRRMGNDVSGAVRVHTIAAIDPAPTRWIETDWSNLNELNRREPRPDQRLTEPVPIALAAERASPVAGGSGGQRLVLVGSGGWMITNTADPVASLGGGRVALLNPGNHELMLASVAWLAGMDDLIAASPMSQEVSRLRGITPEVRMAWWWIIVVGVPLGCLLLGGMMWLWRRM